MSLQAEDPLSLCDIACGSVPVTELVSADVVDVVNEVEGSAAIVAADWAELPAASVVATEAEVSAAIVLKFPD